METLSDKIANPSDYTTTIPCVIDEDDVKEFIKKLKETFTRKFGRGFDKTIDKLAGDKLI